MSGAGPAVIGTVGIVGAGQMGNGIAHVVALAGIDVLLLDAKPEMVSKALAIIGKNLDRQVGKGAIDAARRDAALARIAPAVGYDAMAPCDIVIEAATEKEDVKRAIFAAVIPHLRDFGDEHVLHFRDSAWGGDGSAGQVHRHAFLQSRAGDEAGGDHPRYCHG